MSGHSKWATIKRKKAKTDAQRGKLFTRLAKEIMVAARNGGKDPDGNMQLKTAIQKAKDANIPNENIQRAIQKGAGEHGGANYEEFFYEGYGPGGVAVMLEMMTDNRNRTASEIRHIFSRNGGSLGESGCVAWMFQDKGLIVVERPEGENNEDELMLLALESGAEDMKTGEDSYEITTEPGEFEAVREALEKNGVAIAFAEITKIPSNTITLEGKEAEQMLKLTEALEDHDDVQNVYTNFA
ncbi:MAG: YebC/PmpR family DNA-binding transcriptional regulator [Desulfotomaculaceae bacterium]|nr:YebC/PmpR family DNA-binding transcriptional regulator [Desulfotomaculaceae bacterium]